MARHSTRWTLFSFVLEGAFFCFREGEGKVTPSALFFWVGFPYIETHLYGEWVGHPLRGPLFICLGEGSTFRVLPLMDPPLRGELESAVTSSTLGGVSGAYFGLGAYPGEALSRRVVVLHPGSTPLGNDPPMVRHSAVLSGPETCKNWIISQWV